MILDLFRGPGGWSEGLKMLGLSDIGIEIDTAANLTAKAAGHIGIQADVSTYPTAPFVGNVEGLIASPPCQDFSLAGLRRGIDGDKGKLIREVMRWTRDLLPPWIACEQVPQAEPIWRMFAYEMRALGYNTWVGTLCAADYGVPQERYRTFLLASRGHVTPPDPTHAPDVAHDGLFGGSLHPWVTMADALGWSAPVVYVNGNQRNAAIRPMNRPAPTIHFGARMNDVRWVKRERSGDRSEEGFDPTAGPSQTLTSKARSWTYINGTESTRVSVEEATILQSFRPDYPWQGSRSRQFEQVGNAVPPLLAAHVISAVTGLRIPSSQEAVA